MEGDHQERRSRILTDDDIDELLRRIDTADEERWVRHCESLGYDTSTPIARAEIHADHVWVRTMRTGGNRAIKAMLGALGLGAIYGIIRTIGDLLHLGLQVTLKSKGAG